jgi:uncharacterized protein YqgC (DUF456 family)
MIDILIYIVLGILALAGLVLTIFTLPGIWLVYISIVILAWMGSFQVITPTLLAILFFVSLLSTLLDNVVIALGAKKLGGSNWGMAGAILGGIVGLAIGNIHGMLVGPILGATLFELIFAQKDLKESLRAGFGSFLGIFFSIVLRVALTIAMIVYVLSLVL